MARTSPEPSERIPPQDPSAERGVLSALLSEGFEEAWKLISEQGLRAEHFHWLTNAEIFRRISFVACQGVRPDVVTLAEAIGGRIEMDRDQVLEYLSSAEGAVHVANAGYYAKTILEHAARRAVIRTAQTAMMRAFEKEEAPEELLAGLSEDLRVIEEDAGGTNGRLVTISGSEFLKDPPPARRLLVAEDILAKGEYLLLAGEPKKGKSLLALDLALALAGDADRAEEWAGFTVFGPRRTLYLVGEGGRGSFYRRFEKRSRGLTDEERDRVNLWFPDPKLLSVGAPSDFRKLRNRVLEDGIDLVIVDPLAHFHDLDENSNAEMGILTARFIELKEDTDCALLVVHHTKKNTDEHRRGSAMRSRGASALWGAADGGLVFEHEGDEETDPERRMTFSLRNAETTPDPRLVTLDSASLRFELLARDATHGRGGRPSIEEPSMNEVFAYLREHGEGTYQDIREGTGLALRSLKRWLPNAMNRGELDRVREAANHPYRWFIPAIPETTEEQKTIF